MDITLLVTKINVYDEVSKTSSYTGAKMDDNGSGYMRIFTIDEDRIVLERFWNEACNKVVDLVKPFISSISKLVESHTIDLSNNFTAKLSMPSSFDASLVESINTALFSYFTNYIVGKWYEFTNKEESGAYLLCANSALEDVKSKIYYRKKPTRVKPTTTA
ncbi:MAG: hypothetical protein IJ940_09270 [Bacteroidales bacterium]|nr:hypothetical protein [Bacteroidales bacterium]